MRQASTGQRPLLGLRVLVVEDDYFIALELCTALRTAGATIIGPARDVQSGLAAIEREQIDCAVLDLNLQGRMGFKVAEEVRARDIPVVFATGYDLTMIPENLADVPRLEKPVDLSALCRAVESSVLGARERRAAPAGNP